MATSDCESDDSPLFSGDFRSDTLTLREKAALEGQTPSFNFQNEIETEPVAEHFRDARDGDLFKPAQEVDFGASATALCCDVSGGGEMVACGFRSGDIQVFSSERLVLQYTLSPSEASGPCTAIRFRPENERNETKNVVLAAQGEHVIHFHVTSGTVMGMCREEGNNIYAMDVRGDGEMFATGGSDHIVRIYDETRQEIVSVVGDSELPEGPSHSNRLYSVAWSEENPNVIASGGWDKLVNLWDVRTSERVGSLFGPFVCGDSLSFSGNVIAAGSWRHECPIQLWDWRKGDLLRNMPFHQPHHNACLLYSARIWDTEDARKRVIAGGSGTRPCARLFDYCGELLGTFFAESDVHSICGMERGCGVFICCKSHLVKLDGLV